MECKINNFSDKLNNSFLGLTDKEVRERVIRGEVNKLPKAPSRTLAQMIRANFFNIFNAINIFLAIIVLAAGSIKNTVFAFVIIINSVIGVMQELNARKTLEKLSVISKAHAIVIRDGKRITISVEELVMDDVVYLSTGQQILADCELVKSDEIEIDESMLSGEGDPVFKLEGDRLLSGSFVVSGEGLATVIEVGQETYSSQLAEEAKKFKIVKSELQSSISKIIKLLLWIVGPMSLVLSYTQMRYANLGWRESAIGTVSGIIGMIPEGLVLLTSATFIVSVVKLAKYKTLVQQLSATEILARVDVLCMDKTGTVTEGKLKLKDVVPLGNENISNINKALGILSHNLPSKNPTQVAILERYEDVKNICILEKVPFSSRRKWGGINIRDFGIWILGAPEILLGDNYEKYKEQVEKEARKGRRVLLLAKSKGKTIEDGINDTLIEVALILIEDVIRAEAPEVINFFKEQGVELKVISGDNPVTVSAVSKRAGVFGAENYIDARKLPTDINELKDIVDKYTVFGRVTPHQKKSIVKALQKNEHIVAMTGDGVNDVLALKESDCGIAMANGSDATKAVAQLVLLNSDFGALPKVVAEGRKQINNLERVSELYLSKTALFVLLSILFSILRLSYPMDPIQSSLVGGCAIGIPSFILAMLPYKGRIKGNFLKRILSVSIPNGIIMGAFVTIAYVIAHIENYHVAYCKTLAVLVMTGISIVILVRVSMPLTKSKVRLSIVVGLTCLICFITPFGRYIFSFTPIDLRHWVMSMGLIILSIPLIFNAVKVVRRIMKIEE